MFPRSCNVREIRFSGVVQQALKRISANNFEHEAGNEKRMFGHRVKVLCMACISADLREGMRNVLYVELRLIDMELPKARADERVLRVGVLARVAGNHVRPRHCNSALIAISRSTRSCVSQSSRVSALM